MNYNKLRGRELLDLAKERQIKVKNLKAALEKTQAMLRTRDKKIEQQEKIIETLKPRSIGVLHEKRI